MTAQRICLIDASVPLIEGFKALGCETLALRPAPGETLLDLPAALEKHGFEPELVCQQENLARRIFITGLESVDCPRFFWAIDPHLNAYWHSCYAKLFDLTFCTQDRWREAVGAHGARTAHLPWYGQRMEWRPFSTRSTTLAFAGRVTPQRPSRHWMIETLRERYGERLTVRDDMTVPEMMDFYADARIAPNESILGEVNFRLFEAASCGCLPVTQNLGSEQDALFEPGVETAVYSDVAEMRAVIDRLLADERGCQAMARAGWERLNRDHLPEHRAKTILNAADDVAASAAAPEREKWFVLAAARLLECGPAMLDNHALLRRLGKLGDDPDVMAAQLRLQALAGDTSGLAASAASLLAANRHPSHLDINLCASIGALRSGTTGHPFELARAFLLRQFASEGRSLRSTPDSPTALLREWARELLRHGRVIRHGFPFAKDRHLPGAATDCLVLALDHSPDDLESLKLMETATRGQRGLEHARMGYLSALTLHLRQDWRLGLETALANLRCYRYRQGIEELLAAQEAAAKADADKAFARALRANDPGGLLAAALSL
ncbi:glycosyltransferase family protein [Salidesulfovibrio brasiliensis]|uniref:glycosyltransferase family protein n=1 Tax=Salidesulfovibrio brasiliensis TaxID=221711 RepID=UPI0006CF3501|nr:glycosyltransferase [Salidesulfovibrio brasiliensis]